MLRCGWMVFKSCDWCVSILAVLMGCSLNGPLFCSSLFVVFLDRGHPCHVVRVKSYVNRLLDLAFVLYKVSRSQSTSLPDED